MTIIGCTGTRHLDDAGRNLIVDALSELDPHTDRLVVGGCVGADAYIGAVAKALGLPVHVVLPADRKLVDPHWRAYADSWEEGGVYRQRNQRIVDLADYVFAFPNYPEAEDNPHSGTWMTVRMARRAKKLAYLKPQHPHQGREGTRSGV